MEQDGKTRFTHVVPAGPVIVPPTEGEVVSPFNTVTMWEPVTQTTAFNPPQQPVAIVGYQVIVTRVAPLRVYSVEVPAGTTSLTVPPEFLDAGTEYELEILAIEESGNQTISPTFFETAEQQKLQALATARLLLVQTGFSAPEGPPFARQGSGL